jgi:hypothetical protein
MPAKDIAKFFRGGRIAIPLAVIAVILFFALGGHQKIFNYAVDETAEYLLGSDEGAEGEMSPAGEVAQVEPSEAEVAPPEPAEVIMEASEAKTGEAKMVAMTGAEEKAEEPAAVKAPAKAPEPAPAKEQKKIQPAPPVQEAPDTAFAEPGMEEEPADMRKLIRAYTASFLRDPFFSLVTSEEAVPSKLLDVARAKMVGSVWGESGIIALLEDDRGRSFALKVGDRVVNGSVISVTPASVTFSITMFGLTKSVTLELAEEGEW